MRHLHHDLPTVTLTLKDPDNFGSRSEASVEWFPRQCVTSPFPWWSCGLLCAGQRQRRQGCYNVGNRGRDGLQTQLALHVQPSPVPPRGPPPQQQLEESNFDQYIFSVFWFPGAHSSCASGASSTTFSLTSSSSEGPLSTRLHASFARSSGGVPACCALPHECVLLWSPSQSSRDEHPGPPSQRLPLRVQTAYFPGTHTSAHDPSAHSVSSLSHTK